MDKKYLDIKLSQLKTRATYSDFDGAMCYSMSPPTFYYDKDTLGSLKCSNCGKEFGSDNDLKLDKNDIEIFDISWYEDYEKIQALLRAVDISSELEVNCSKCIREGKAPLIFSLYLKEKVIYSSHGRIVANSIEFGESNYYIQQPLKKLFKIETEYLENETVILVSKLTDKEIIEMIDSLHDDPETVIDVFLNSLTEEDLEELFFYNKDYLKVLLARFFGVEGKVEDEKK